MPASGPVAPIPLPLPQRLCAIACHLCLFVAGPFLVPFIVWLVARQDWPFVALHAREALNFHVSLLIYGLALVVLALPLVITLIGIPVLIAAVFALALGPLILAILAAIKASEGNAYHYPLTLPIFR
jgi:uncharacterized Tic20 family protein